LKCSHCGAELVCRACGSPVEGLPHEAAELDELVSGVLPPAESPASSDEQNVLLVVARGHRALYEQLRAVVGELGHVRVIEDRRRDRTLLPREGREGSPHVET
jgi:hypothetical protein